MFRWWEKSTSQQTRRSLNRDGLHSQCMTIPMANIHKRGCFFDNNTHPALEKEGPFHFKGETFWPCPVEEYFLDGTCCRVCPKFPARNLRIRDAQFPENGADDNFIAISVHVNDQTIIARFLPPVISIKHALATRFGIDDLGEITYMLGLVVQRDSASGRLLLSQRKSIATILERFSKYVPPPCSIPMWTQQQVRRYPCKRALIPSLRKTPWRRFPTGSSLGPSYT